MTAKIPALFFCERGLGPSESELWVERHDPRRPELGDKLYYGLRIASGLLGEKADAGGFMLSHDDAAALHRQLGEALGVDLRGLLQRCRDVLALGRLVGFDRDALPYLIRDLEKALQETT